jgi:uracil-DNA glycosylase family 4
MSSAPAFLDPDPPRDCPLCPRLVEFREEARRLHPDWFNAPVPNWGDSDPRLLIIGLAPGLRGANRTGRPFTGDYAGDTLYRALLKFGLATGEYRADPADSLTLRGVRIVNGVHCVPPANKPTPAEIKTCRRYMASAFAIHHEVRAFLVLGRIAHDQLLSTLGERRVAFPFKHGAEHILPDGRRLFDSYHCSRYNTNTGVLTEAMFEDVVGRAAAFIGTEP